MRTVAILDEKRRLVGLRKLKAKEKPRDDEVLVDDRCDLPTDGTYKHDEDREAFMPLGRGFPRVRRAPVSDSRVLYLMAKQLGKDMPQEVRDWVSWYEDNLNRRDEEEARKR